MGRFPLENLLADLFATPHHPTEVHQAIARVAKAGHFAAIVTTNYDRLLETALDMAGFPPITQTLEGNQQVSGRLRLLKIHGSQEDWRRTVLSGKSYQEFEERYRFLTEQLDVLLSQHSVLFLGCSMEDPRILNWLENRQEGLDLQTWRPTMTQEEWRRVGETSSLRAPEIRPFLLKDHPQLIPLWTEVADRLAPSESTRIDVVLTVDGESWRVESEGIESYERKDLLRGDSDDRSAGNFDDDLETLRDSDHRPVPTAASGIPTPETQERSVTPLQILAVRVGERLTTGVLSDALREKLQGVVNASMAREPAHLHLVVKPRDPSNPDHVDRANETLSLPWELIRLENDFPVSQGTLDVTREAYLAGLEGLSEPTSELKVVAAVSAPIDVTQLNYEEESYRLASALGEDRSRFEVTDLGTVDELIGEIKKNRPPIVHFTGHGDPGTLYFETETGEKDPVSVEGLIERLRADQASFPRLLYLACCYGATSGGRPTAGGPGGRITLEGGAKGRFF